MGSLSSRLSVKSFQSPKFSGGDNSNIYLFLPLPISSHKIETFTIWEGLCDRALASEGEAPFTHMSYRFTINSFQVF